MTDPELRDVALDKFRTEFTKKFNAGIREHNPNGDRGLLKMTIPQLLRAAHEEVYDLHSYLCALEAKFHAAEVAEEMRQNKNQT